MTVKRRLSLLALLRHLNPLRLLPPALRPAPWHWWHTLAALVALVVAGLASLFPSDSAAAAGQVILAADHARYFRTGLVAFALLVALGIRGHPWWHTLVCLLIAAFAGGQLARAIYTPEVQGIPLALLWMNLGCTVYLIALAVRPSVYEQLQDSQQENHLLREENRRLRGDA